MYDNQSDQIYFLDPRGSFGPIKIYGDPLYDYAKLYYSVVGNYDQLNLGNFRLMFDGADINLRIQSQNYEVHEEQFMQRFSNSEMRKLRLIHSLIWLSLTGYFLDNIDAALASYFNGLYWFQEYLRM